MSIVTQLTNPSVSNEYIQSSNHLLSIVVNITLSNKQKKSIYIYIYKQRPHVGKHKVLPSGVFYVLG